MRCPVCKAYVPYDSKLKKCPACDAAIEKKPFLEDFFNMVAEFSAEKNFIFWGFAALVAGMLIGAVEFALGHGRLLDYYEGNLFHSIIIFLYWGIVLELVVKANAHIRLAAKTVIIKERRVLRVFRIGTNLAFLAGIITALIWIGPSDVFSNLPAFTLITTSVICLFWAGEGIFFREEHFQDTRVRNFFLPLGVRHPHPYRVASAWFIALLVFALAIYSLLMMFPTIFWGVYNTWFVQSTIKFIKSFLAYLPV